MSVLYKRGATETAGTDVTLVPSGIQPGKAVFADPDSTRLAPRNVTFTTSVSGTSNTNPGIARASARISYADRSTEEGCCTVNAGAAVIDVGMSWALNQPEELALAALYDLRGMVFTQWFKDLWLKGMLPA